MCAPSAGAPLRTRSGVRESFAAGPDDRRARAVLELRDRLEHVALAHVRVARGLGVAAHRASRADRAATSVATTSATLCAARPTPRRARSAPRGGAMRCRRVA